jgi:hypothetical protein
MRAMVLAGRIIKAHSFSRVASASGKHRQAPAQPTYVPFRCAEDPTQDSASSLNSGSASSAWCCAGRGKGRRAPRVGPEHGTSGVMAGFQGAPRMRSSSVAQHVVRAFRKVVQNRGHRSWGCRCQMARRRNLCRGNTPEAPRRRCAPALTYAAPEGGARKAV